MDFFRLYDEQLAQASYLIGCSATGAALVVDPNRDAGQYQATATAHGLRIAAVTETHIHADFVSGARELAARTGATMYLSTAGPPEWHYRFEREPGVVGLANGDRFRVGNLEIQAIHTPGHTPEHLSFLLTDTAVADTPMGIFTGDFVFVNDVGRPDLLEKAAHIAGTASLGAAQLFRSLQWFKTLPDHLQIWPGHGAGSACGKGMSAVPQSTVGYERRYNWALEAMDEASFIARVLEGQPEPPRYFGVMKRVNREGPVLLGSLPAPRLVSAGELEGLLSTGATIADTRPAEVFAEGHAGGTLNLPFNRSFATWAGALLPYDRDVYLIADPAVRDEVVHALRLIGLDRIVGVIPPEALEPLRGKDGRWRTIPQLTPAEVARRRNTLVVLDVRGRSEWEHGRIPGAVHIPLAELPERLQEIPAGSIAVHCQGGGRSAIAASLLESAGRLEVANLTGGMSAWSLAGLPTENHSLRGGSTTLGQ
jgi:hydroxyacylglutathione hydrolase